MTPDKMRVAYGNHKRSAKYRGIAFLLSFEQWLNIWKTSGKLELRGKGAGKYVMSRNGDIGPYSEDNVRIILNSENVSEGSAGNVPWCKGKKDIFSPEALQKKRDAMLGNTNHLKRKTYGNRYHKGIPKNS